MIDAVIVVVGVLIFSGTLVVVAFLAARNRTAVKAAASAPSGGHVRDSYTEAFTDSTGMVEVTGPAPEPVPAPGPGPASAAAPLFDLEREPNPEAEAALAAPPLPPPEEIRWCRQFDARSGALDDTARLRLIGDLGVVGKEWCVPLLCRAYAEERRPSNRRAALISLAACRSQTAVPTYRLALASGDADERGIAADALADLEPPAQNKPRTVVER